MDKPRKELKVRQGGTVVVNDQPEAKPVKKEQENAN